MKSRGFFSDEEVTAPTRMHKQAEFGCGICGLNKQCLSPKMKPSGAGRKGILIVAEAPGRTEDEKGTQLVGEAGRLLRRKLEEYDIDLDRDCWKTNAVCCRPPKNRAPKSVEIASCRPNVWKTIEEYRPKLILLCGGPAVESFVGDRWNHNRLEGIGRWRGWTIPDRKARAWVCPIFHPSYVKRSQDAKERTLCVEKVFDQDLERAVKKLSVPFPCGDLIREEEMVKIITDERELRNRLTRLIPHYEDHPEDLLTIDLETTGLKPYREGHEIVSCAISPRIDEAIAFPWPQGVAKGALHRLFVHPGIKKVAANAPFEDRWLHHFKYAIDDWYWDTLLAAHVLDNRPHITGLKFQAYVRYGVVGYSDDADKWLESGDSEKSKYGSNGFNRVKEFFNKEPQKLLLYNGMDALLTGRLASDQIGEMR